MLVLEDEADNDLKLESGDVILELAGQPVSRPADLMRAMRDLESGQNIRLAIMRDKQGQDLEVVVPDRRTSGYQLEWISPDSATPIIADGQHDVLIDLVHPGSR